MWSVLSSCGALRLLYPFSPLKKSLISERFPSHTTSIGHAPHIFVSAKGQDFTGISQLIETSQFQTLKGKSVAWEPAELYLPFTA
jgi:hypothetical protein